MPFIIVRNDITKVQADAIVNAANSSLLGGGGVDGAIHRAAGPALMEECRALGGCGVGEAKATKGYNLPARHVIHTVGPVWQGGHRDEPRLLASCYRQSLLLAEQLGCESVAFPLISAGAYGYPAGEAMRIARREITAFLADRDMTVFLVLFDRDAHRTGRQLFPEIAEYIDDRYALAYGETPQERARRFPGNLPRRQASRFSAPSESRAPKMDRPLSAPRSMPLEDAAPCPGSAVPEGLSDALSHLDEGFSGLLLRLIDRSGMTDAECYHRANIDRKLFSKIRSNPSYRPSKPTALAFAVALRLSLPEAKELLARAGFALSPSSKFDVIVEYFITRGRYDVFEINEALFAFDQNLLGG